MVPLYLATRMARGPRARPAQAAISTADGATRLAEMMADAGAFAEERIGRIEAHRTATKAEEQSQRSSDFLQCVGKVL